MHRPGCSRRALFRAAAGVLAAGVGTVGCASARGRAGAPASSARVQQVPFQLYFPGAFQTTSSRQLVQQFVDQQFNARRKGIRALWQPSGNMSGVVAQILAGGPAPVVLSSCCGDWPVIVPFLQALDGYLQKDNIDIAKTWTTRQLAQFRASGHLLALPEDAATQAYVYRQDILDSLGLSYPDAGWTYEDAARIWKSCTSDQGGRHRYGATIPWQPAGPFPGLALLHGFGGGLVAPDGTTCLLEGPGSVSAGHWVFDQIWSGVGTNGGGVPAAGLKTGQIVFSQGADPTILWCVENLTGGAKWDFLPFPAWPKGPATIFQSNFYGMNAVAPNKELAWELLRFAAVDTDWSRFYMHLTMAPPALVALLPEWETLLRGVAPVLQNKTLKYWTEPALKGEGHDAYAFFKYDAVQANALIGATWAEIWNHRTGVTEGFGAITRQVDALQVSAAAGPPPPDAAQRLAANRAASKKFPSSGPAVATVAPGL